MKVLLNFVLNYSLLISFVPSLFQVQKKIFFLHIRKKLSIFYYPKKSVVFSDIEKSVNFFYYLQKKAYSIFYHLQKIALAFSILSSEKSVAFSDLSILLLIIELQYHLLYIFILMNKTCMTKTCLILKTRRN